MQRCCASAARQGQGAHVPLGEDALTQTLACVPAAAVSQAIFCNARLCGYNVLFEPFHGWIYIGSSCVHLMAPAPFLRQRQWLWRPPLVEPVAASLVTFFVRTP